MHYALFNSVFGRNKVNCYCYLKFPCVRYFEIIYDTFQVCLNPMKVFFDWKGFNVVAITLILNIVVDIGTIYFHWFVIIFFLFTKVRDISCYAVFDFVILFFSLIKLKTLLDHSFYFSFYLSVYSSILRMFKLRNIWDSFSKKRLYGDRTSKLHDMNHNCYSLRQWKKYFGSYILKQIC